MSLVYITYHNENIFNVAESYETGIPPFRQGRRYVSKFKNAVSDQQKKRSVIELEDGQKLLTSSHKSKHKTFGYAETPLSPPCAFLRKNGGVKWRRLNEHVCPKGRDIPPVPRYIRQKSEQIGTVASTDAASKKKETNQNESNCPHRRYFKNHKHRANFVLINIERNKTAKTNNSPPRYVDTPLGTRHDLLNTGLIPQYICSKSFGKVPVYLKVQNKMLQRVRDRCRQEAQQQEDKCRMFLNHGLRQMKPEERKEILEGLKINFAELSKIYQGLSLYTDTLAKKLRKGKLEKELRQIEQDMLLMETNHVIYVNE